MASPGTSFSHLCRCLQGRVPKNVDWTPLIGLANQTLTTPALKDVADQFPEEIPEEVRRYVGEIFARNLARNDRLAEQLRECLAALNAQGIIPMLLKGSAMLTTSPRMKMGRRLVSDLDIVVSPEELKGSLDCLSRLGYRIQAMAPDEGARWYADLARPGDVGMIDLQLRPPGHGVFYSAAGDARRHCRLQQSAYVPSETYHALMLIIHDQFQDADYWVGKIDLRHLLDLRDLANSPAGIDWDLLASLTPGKLARNAIETQLVALSCLLGVRVPDRMVRRVVPRLQHWRRRLQTHLPVLRGALFLLAMLDYGNYRAEMGLKAQGEARSPRGRRILPRIETMRFLLALSSEQRAGKV